MGPGSTMKRQIQDIAREAVVTVGDGRGFIMETTYSIQKRHVASRVIVTAAHCLPHLPPAASFVFSHEKTYMNLLGPLGHSKPAVTAECLFVDPITDLAVLGAPDGEQFPNAPQAFEDLTESVQVLPLGDMRARSATGWLLSLDGHWGKCKVEALPSYGLTQQTLWITEATGGMMGGMSGSPILLDNGKVLGVLSASSEPRVGRCTEGGPQARLAHCLPSWLLQGIKRSGK